MKNIFREDVVQYEILLPIVIFLLFLAVSIPGVNWGVPALWNPDELVWRVDEALRGDMVFDQTEPDFNYPSLPKYVMYGIGKITYGMGHSRFMFIIAVRIFSCLLGAIAGVFVYFMARMIGTNKLMSVLAGLLYIASGVAAANGRFAHNDLYLQFFAILCVWFSIKYQLTKRLFWIYCSFFAVGLAASSKYTGGSLLLLPLFILIFMNWQDFRKSQFQSLTRIFIGSILSFLGYVIGTPSALFFVGYIKNVIPALVHFSQYGFNSGTPMGLFGQWNVFKDAVGFFSYYLFILCFLWFVFKLIYRYFDKTLMDDKKAQVVLILIVAILIFDLPFIFSVNYVPRFFIPFVPFLSILGALFVQDVVDLAAIKGWKFLTISVIVLLFAGTVYSMLRLVSTALVFMNDARMPASAYIASLRGYKKVIEYTLYPPIVNRKQFYEARNYPIYFVKYPDDQVPTGGRFEYNQGEKGLIDRNVDFFVIDTFTYTRFNNKGICQSSPVECEFFKKLLAGNIATFHLVKEFTYSVPPFLPQVFISAVNPEIRIYERVR